MPPLVKNGSSRAAALPAAPVAPISSPWIFFSRQAIRRSGKFELFYFTHLLYLTWFTFALVHGRVFWMWAGVPLLGTQPEMLFHQ